jgi:ABC-type multidrug transport system permease subunit
MKTLFSLAASIREDYARRRILLETRGLSGLIINSKGYVLIIALLMTSLLISITGNLSWRPRPASPT